MPRASPADKAPIAPKTGCPQRRNAAPQASVRPVVAVSMGYSVAQRLASAHGLIMGTVTAARKPAHGDARARAPSPAEKTTRLMHTLAINHAASL